MIDHFFYRLSNWVILLLQLVLAMLVGTYLLTFFGIFLIMELRTIKPVLAEVATQVNIIFLAFLLFYTLMNYKKIKGIWRKLF